MPRRSPTSLLAILATALVATAAACDTGDGKALRPPTSDQRLNMPTTTTTTTTTVAVAAPELGAGIASTTGATLPSALATPPVDAAAAAGPFTLTVPWANGGPIDARFTCDGAGASPLLIWTAPPLGTVELALLVTDDDAEGYVHWAVAGIVPTAGEKGEGATITGAIEGVNGSGITGWSGPCPPPGAPHTYRFTLYALDQQAELPDGFTGADLAAVAGPASIAIAELTGTYTRAG